MGEEPHPEWIDKLVALAARVGINPTRLRWKLIRWHDKRKRAQEAPPIEFRGRRMFRQLGLTSPQAISVSTLIALAIMATYTRVFVAQGGGFGAPSGARLLYDFGAQWELGSSGEPWRLVTAMFLHIGLWHLAFNLIAIATIGPQIEAIYGRLTMLFIFIATGVLANLGSGHVQPAVLSAGASGGLCGLIGAAAGYGQRIGTSGGRLIRNDMLKWIAYTIIFGFVVHANNYAHAFGAISGAAFGYAIPPRSWNRPVLAPLRIVAQAFGVVAMAGAVAIIMTRTPRDHSTNTLEDVVVADYRFASTLCELFATGATTEAQQLLEVRHGMVGPGDVLVETHVEVLCGSLAEIRAQCKSGSLDPQLAGGQDMAPPVRDHRSREPLIARHTGIVAGVRHEAVVKARDRRCGEHAADLALRQLDVGGHRSFHRYRPGRSDRSLDVFLALLLLPVAIELVGDGELDEPVVHLGQRAILGRLAIARLLLARGFLVCELRDDPPAQLLLRFGHLGDVDEDRLARIVGRTRLLEIVARRELERHGRARAHRDVAGARWLRRDHPHRRRHVILDRDDRLPAPLAAQHAVVRRHDTLDGRCLYRARACDLCREFRRIRWCGIRDRDHRSRTPRCGCWCGRTIARTARDQREHDHPSQHDQCAAAVFAVHAFTAA